VAGLQRFRRRTRRGPRGSSHRLAVVLGHPELKGFLASQVPLGRLGTSDEIASVALFLAGGQSSFVTGIELFVDGGVNQIRPPPTAAPQRSQNRHYGPAGPAPLGC
jgi:NAD(P)-dependent dehydrogenase (short-subunit alcohol dehydrogenase family)